MILKLKNPIDNYFNYANNNGHCDNSNFSEHHNDNFGLKSNEIINNINLTSINDMMSTQQYIYNSRMNILRMLFGMQ